MVCAKLSALCFMSTSTLDKSVLVAYDVSFLVRDWIFRAI